MSYGLNPIIFRKANNHLELATKIALTAMKKYEHNFSRIIACCISPVDAGIYQAFLDYLTSLCTETVLQLSELHLSVSQYRLLLLTLRDLQYPLDKQRLFQ